MFKIRFLFCSILFTICSICCAVKANSTPSCYNKCCNISNILYQFSLHKAGTVLPICTKWFLIDHEAGFLGAVRVCTVYKTDITAWYRLCIRDLQALPSTPDAGITFSCGRAVPSIFLDFYTPAQRSWRGVYWIHLVRPSVRLSVDMVSGA